ncbi:site-specific DNA-methyltransferase [Lactococcus petauri]|uniref:site-specific DNA-methyltransferase n=1 Tax=Lactococcus petauri TaxID=1940789 RepID=UPI0018AB0D2F|nr:site-specific DNA-methyltransferase [Lactococcus petauri]MDC0825838.1 DNA methyltransferase [Lactococcus petauri]
MSEKNNLGLRENQEYNAQVKANTAFLEELKNKLPEYFTTSGSFDLEKFQENLKENNIDELSSGYQLDFIGKNLAKKQAGERPSTVIVPDMEHNEKPENKKSKNLFLTGDNLEVLRHLQSAYQNSVDFIYIDPPYNTGSDGFVYPDKFEYTDEQLKDNFALTDKELERLKSIQGKSTHSAWLTFMYPRLYLAKKLLKDSGVIFVSIDDNEQANLKLLMDNIFGEEAFVSNVIWQSRTSISNDFEISMNHNSTLIYSKIRSLLQFGGDDIDSSEYRNPDNDKRGPWKLVPIDANHAGGDTTYPIINPKTGKEYFPPNGRIWAYNRETFEKLFADNRIMFGLTGDSSPKRKLFYEERIQKGDFKTPSSILLNAGSTKLGTSEIMGYFENKKVFDFPKPSSLVKRFLNWGKLSKNSVILDFFAGSATTADAVMQLNAEDGGNRKFILAQLPEPTRENSVAKKSGYTTIDQISRERIKRAGAKIKYENPLTTADLDTGFKHYRFVEPTQKALDQIEFDENMNLDLFDDMISLFSSENLSVDGKATGFDTLLQTYLLADNYTFETSVMMKDFAGTKVAYANNTRLYIITDAWSAENTKALVNAIGTNELTVQTIVVYGYTLPMEAIRELEIALNQLETKVNLQIRY